MPTGVRHKKRPAATKVARVPSAVAPRIKDLNFVQVEVTPDMAARWLEGKCPNRPIYQTQVEKYARDMVAGAWHLNGETVVFSDDDGLLDGQHRLWAIVESGVTVKLCVVRGADKHSMDTFDMGRARSFSDALSIAGHSDSNRFVAGAARWLRWYDGFRRGGLTMGGSASHAELKSVVDRHPLVHMAAEAVGGSKQAKKLIAPAVLTFVMTGALERDAERAQSWLDALATGQNLPSDSGTYLLREKMIANSGATAKLQAMSMAAYTIKAWNYWYKDRPLRALRWGAAGGKAESFPTFED